MFLGANPAASVLIFPALFVVYVCNERRKMGAHWILSLMCVPFAMSELITWASPTPQHRTILNLLVNYIMHAGIYKAPNNQCLDLYGNCIWDRIWRNESKKLSNSFSFFSHYLLHITAILSPTPATASYLDCLDPLLPHRPLAYLMQWSFQA